MISQLFTASPFWSNPLLQSTVFIAAGLMASWLLRRRSARAHQVLFLAVIAAVVVPAMSMIVRHYELGMFVDKPAVTQSHPAEIHIVPIITEYEISPLPAIPNTYSPPAIEAEYAIPAAAVVSEAKAKLPLSTILIWSWIIVSTILGVRLFITFILGLGMLRRALPMRCDKLRQALLIAKSKLGIDKPVHVLAGNTVSSPVIWCWSRRPALLVPEDAEQFEDGVDWVDMFCHELAHWSRLDHISGFFAELMVCLFPWHPLMWWAKSRLAGLSEQACDDWVVAGSRSPTDYAESLLDLSPQRQLSFLPAVVGRKNGLESRIRRIVKDKCGKPHLGLCWAVVVTLIAACITIGAAFAQRRPADIEQVKECEKLLSNEHKHEQHAEEHKHELLSQEQELLAKQQDLLAEEQQQLDILSKQLKLKKLEQLQLDRLGSQLQLEQSKQKEKSEDEAAMQFRMAHIKNLNSLAQQQAEYRLQADVLESEIKLLQLEQDHLNKLAAEDKPGQVLDKEENEVRKLEAEQLLAELKALRVKINNIENRLQASLSSKYVIRDPLLQDVTSCLYEKTTHSDPIQQTKQRDQHTQYKRILQIEADNLQQEIEFLDGLRQDELEKAETHEQMRATLEAIDNNRHRIRSNVPPTLIGGELFKDDELAVLKKLRRDLQILTDKTKLQIDDLGDKEEANKLRGDLKKIDAFIQHIDGRINSPTVWPQQRLQSRDEYEAKRKLLLPKRRELEDLRKHNQFLLKEAPSREDAARLRASLDEIDKKIRGIDFELSSPEWCGQKRKAEQTAMQKYNEEMERAKANFNLTTKRRDADYDAMDDFDLKNRKAEQTAMQKYKSERERAKANFNLTTKRRDADNAMDDFNLKNRESEWWAEMRAFEADVVAAKQKIIDTHQKYEDDLATLKKMQQDIEFFTIENGANLGKDISLYNKWQTMKTNRDKLRTQIEREKGVLTKYQKEFKAAVERKDTYRKYKPPAGTELDYWMAQRKTKAPVMKGDPWNTAPPQQGQGFRRRQQIQTTTPPSQQGQAYSPWLRPGEKQQPGEKLQSRINQLQDEISRLRFEMSEMRKLMKDLVEQKKKQPGLYNLYKKPTDIEENRHKKPLENIHKGPKVPKLKETPFTGLHFHQGNTENLPKLGNKLPKKPPSEILGDPPAPENIEPTPSEKKRHEHPTEEIPNEPDEIGTTEPIPLPLDD
jgi:beta-lactamase regulating signal transducer with metallopeptidase domain